MEAISLCLLLHTTSYSNTRGPKSHKNFYIYILNLFTPYTFTLYILCFNIIKVETIKRGAP